MRHDTIDYTGSLFTFQFSFRKCFFQGATYKAIFSIGYGLFAILVHYLCDIFRFTGTNRQDFISIRQFCYHTLYIPVVFQ